jgi:hypothetical protein
MLLGVSESFVDLSYRGLSIGKRIRLSQVRPSSGYIESPQPMPVGTTIAMTTDEGVALDVRVAGVHEQVGGSTQPPGMHVRPTLTEDKASLWWQARVTLPDDPALREEPRKSVTVRPRGKTIPQPVVTPEPAPTIADAAPTLRESPGPSPTEPDPPQVPAPPVLPPGADDGKKTVVMSAVDQETLAKLMRSDRDTDSPPVDQSNGTPLPPAADHPIVDDGLRTTVMEAVDVSALGLGIEVSSSGSMTMVHDDDVPDEAGDSGSMPAAGDSGPSSGDKKKRRKKRR